MTYKIKRKKKKSQQYEDYILYGDKERDEEKGYKLKKKKPKKQSEQWEISSKDVYTI